MYVVLVTCPDMKSAEKVADTLLKKRLAACINIVPGLTSKYWWKGKIEKSSEVLLIIKTREELLPALTKAVKKVHPYSIPEVISLPVYGGLKGYIRWAEKETSRSGAAGKKKVRK